MRRFLPWAPSLLGVAMIVLTVAHAAADDCADATLVGSPAAEELCSDTIARLSYQSTSAASTDTTTSGALAAAYNNRAAARIVSGDLSGAEEDVAEAVDLLGEHWAVLINRGNLRLARDQPQAALADYARAQALSREADPAVLKNSVLAYRALGDLGRASASLLSAESISRRGAPDTPGERARPPR